MGCHGLVGFRYRAVTPLSRCCTVLVFITPTSLREVARFTLNPVGCEVSLTRHQEAPERLDREACTAKATY